MKKLLSTITILICYSNLFGQSLMGVESVEYDPINNRYLASSDNNSIVAISPEGSLSYFGSGTEASHGMEIFGGRLYAINGSEIRVYDLNTEMLIFSQNISGAQFLNGMASNGVDSIWFTDFSGSDIYAMDVTEPSNYTMIASNIGVTPNGIAYDGDNNRCVFVTWGTGKIKAIDLNTYQITDLVANTGLSNIDGIDRNANGDWFISSWSPAAITKYASNFSAALETLPVAVSQPADICYSTETDSLAIPGNDEVIFVGFTGNTVGIEEDDSFEAYTINYENGSPTVSFEFVYNQEAILEIVDLNGKVMLNIFNGLQPSGKKRINLSASGLSAGAYIFRLQSKELVFSERIFIP